MTNKIKKPLSVLLSILMALSVFGGLTISSSAAEKTNAAAPFSALAVPEGTPLTDQLPSTQGTYYLTQDITISSTWLAPSGATTLDLNGYGIRMTGTGTVIDVCRDASCVLTLNDSRPTYSGGENRPSGILGGYITGGTGSKNHPGTSTAAKILGGGIYVNNAVLNINGGTITGNSAAWGGGIYIYNDCTVNMTGGAITGNSCARGGYGGGVFLSASSTFNVSHTPSIIGNYYSYNGKQYPKNVHMQVVASGGKSLYAVITIVSPGLTAGAQIGISELQTNAYPVTSGYSTYHSGVDPGTYFSCDTAGYAYKVNSEGELLSVPAFTITWKNDDDTLIDTTTVAGGTVPTHADATKDATAQYTYTFAGWSDGTTTYAPDDALPEVIRNATYKATFTQTDREYTITWKNDDGSVIDTTTVPYGTVPTHADATKDADTYYTYAFAGWTPAIEAVTGDATYTATFDAAAKTFTVNVKNLKGETVAAPEVTGETTVAELKALLAGTAQIPAAEQRIIFAGRQLEDGKALSEYNIQRGSTLHLIVKSYTITWNNDDGTLIDTTTVAYGSVPTHDDPVKEADAQYIYTFAGWSPEVTAVTGEATYTATYTSEVNPAVAFEAYKAEKKAAVEAMAEEGDSAAAAQIIADAAAAIDALTYDEAKTLAENKAAVDEIADIADALAAQRAADKLAADKAAFEAYKAEKKAAVEAMGEEGDSEAAQQIIANAAAAIEALTYDEAKTLAENKAAADEIADIADRLAAQRAADANRAAADAVESLIDAIGEVEYTDESKAKIDAAKAAYDALTDAQKALVDNADVLTAAEAKYDELKAAAETPDDPEDPTTPTDPDAPAEEGVCPICGKVHGNSLYEQFISIIHSIIILIKWIAGGFKGVY